MPWVCRRVQTTQRPARTLLTLRMRLAGLVEDAALIVLSILAVPTAVLLVGMPIALVVQAVIWITTRP